MTHAEDGGRKLFLVALGLPCLLAIVIIADAQSVSFNSIRLLDIRKAVDVDDPRVDESSGLAFSHRDQSCVWTHNDSGDGPILYSIETATGKLVGLWALAETSAIDWEDMAVVDQDGQAKLVVADVGDNQARRASVAIHIVDEPEPRAIGTISKDQIRTIRIRFQGGPTDCEAIWFDSSTESMMLLAKRIGFSATLYKLPLAERPDDDGTVIARAVGALPTPMATGGDRDATNGDVWITSYWNAWRFPGGDFNTPPEVFRVPAMKQIEAITLDRQGVVWITTEGSPCRLAALNQATAPGHGPPPNRIPTESVGR
ncbi:MAG: hypothetical protein AAF670_13570 [Planctomycetota bacterium]